MIQVAFLSFLKGGRHVLRRRERVRHQIRRGSIEVSGVKTGIVLDLVPRTCRKLGNLGVKGIELAAAIDLAFNHARIDDVLAVTVRLVVLREEQPGERRRLAVDYRVQVECKYPRFAVTQ